MNRVPAELAPRIAPVLDMSVSAWRENWRVLYDMAATAGLGGVLLRGGRRRDWAKVAREAAGLGARAPLVMADFEQGAASQLAGYPWLPKALTVGSSGSAELARALGAAIAAQARELGVDMVLAPVADLLFPFTHSVIGSRSFGATPEAVGTMAASFVEGCQAGGVKAAVKHFPGHGRSRQDSHRRMPTIAVGQRAWSQTDRVPFARAIEAGVSAVMVGHLWFGSLDRVRRPASRSARIMRDLLRGVMGFRGIVMTDSLEMVGAGGFGMEAVAAAVDAGADIVLGPDVGLAAHGPPVRPDDPSRARPRPADQALARLIAERGVAWLGCADLKRRTAVPVDLHVVADRGGTTKWADALREALGTHDALSRGGSLMIALPGTVESRHVCRVVDGIARATGADAAVAVVCGAWQAAMRLAERMPVLYAGDGTTASQEALARVVCGEIEAIGRVDLPRP